VTRSDFQEAWSEQAEEDFLKSQGLMEEELRSMPLWRRAKGRLIWLGANVFLNAIAASVIAMHQDTLSAVIALAVFLPIVSDMSGNAGFQAAAVSMRELALGVVRPEELWRVFCKEVSVGLLNGLVLGLLLGGLAWAWKGNPWLGLVAGGAMALNTVISVVIGGTMPLILRKFNKDPALASGPILTTLTDMAGFFLVLTFAAALLEKIQT
jgi:magnesium transporter